MGLIPMVKADAYGLGAEHVARTLHAALGPEGPWAFGVATVCEGEALRGGGWEGRILVFSPTPPEEYLRAAKAALTLCLSELDAVRHWREAAHAVGRHLAFHAEIDTGIGRAGFAAAEAGVWGWEVARIAEGALRWEGCYTHFHSSDEPDLEPTYRQWARFEAALRELPEPAPGERRVLHSSNSGAALRCAGFACDLARPGISLYGGRAGSELEIEPVVQVRARLVLVRDVAEGSTAGYGATYTSRRPERWGTVAIGYADGIPRALATGGGEVLVHGRRVPIIGRISMDVLTVDLSDVPEAAAGDVATLIGRDGEAEISLDEVASRTGTIGYEILTGLTRRLPRVYLDG